LALIPCKECGKEISDKAVTCPNCGVPVPIIDQSNLDSSSLGKTKIASPLIPCRVCKTEVLQKAFICPNCGIHNPDTIDSVLF
jgi:RNA polymerase subunit RPABC4/transcription elongation factor Spt4